MKTIYTERLIIRNFTENDGEDLYEYLGDEEVVRYEPYKPFSLQQSKTEAIRRAGDKNFLAVALRNGKLIGNLYFAKGDFETWEIGYVFNRDYWNQGYAVESANELINYIFEKENAWRIMAMCDPMNKSSWKLLERLGFRREGHLLKNVYFFKDEYGKPIWKDTYEYGILKEEYRLIDIPL
ncbi:MAG TPA: GNAT family N-acetyltransferase [Epulopiscium sp.]|nr:GNAT family N-acetyltransferase [Candidatus Epulonipiscium sp.]